jgi:3-hydroxy-9,10-secoandrosta-1,3,5(10)-triene-9,17-dione monooxygenase reductase component
VIHEEHPFADDPARRDPARRFRGRLSAPVTIVTAGGPDDRTGLTVSSLIVIEGSPARIAAVVSPTTDLWDVASETGRFVVHVCGLQHRSLAEVFAGLRPSPPGGIFAGLEVSASDWGPVIATITDRAYCTFESRREIGYSGLVTARIDQVETGDLTDPLIYFRGKYHTLQ